jgi:hypothetical protein
MITMRVTTTKPLLVAVAVAVAVVVAVVEEVTGFSSQRSSTISRR